MEAVSPLITWNVYRDNDDDDDDVDGADAARLASCCSLLDHEEGSATCVRSTIVFGWAFIDSCIRSDGCMVQH